MSYDWYDADVYFEGEYYYVTADLDEPGYFKDVNEGGWLFAEITDNPTFANLVIYYQDDDLGELEITPSEELLTTALNVLEEVYWAKEL